MMFFSAADILGYSSALTAAAYGRSRAQALAFCLAALCSLGEKAYHSMQRERERETSTKVIDLKVDGIFRKMNLSDLLYMCISKDKIEF